MIAMHKPFLRVCLPILIASCLASTSLSHELKINNDPVRHAHYFQDGVATDDNDPNEAGHYVREGSRHPQRPVRLDFRWRQRYTAGIRARHPNVTIIDDPTYEYNCSGYAFSQTEGEEWDPPFYITRAATKEILKKGHYVKIPKKFSHHWDSCDVVVYYDGPGEAANITHLGHVREVVDGNIARMRSKWGPGPLVEHTPEDVPKNRPGTYLPPGGRWEVTRKCGMCINEYECRGVGKYHVNEPVKVLRVTGDANVSVGDILEPGTIVEVQSGTVKVVPVEGEKLGFRSQAVSDCPGDYTPYMDIIHGSYTLEEYGGCDTTEHCGGYTPFSDFWVDVTPDTFVTAYEVTHDTVENFTTIYNFPESPHDIVYSPRVGPDSGDCFTLSPGWTVEINSSGVIPCGMQQDSGNIAWINGAFEEGDRVVQYYNPGDYCEPEVYPYNIHDIDFYFYDVGSGSLPVSIRIYLQCEDSCDGPGTPVFASDPFVPDLYPNMAHVEFDQPICVYEPFYIGWEYLAGIPGSTPSPLFMDGLVEPAEYCHAWFYEVSAGFWIEHFDFWNDPVAVGYPLIRVSGYTESPACDIAPCDTTLETLYGSPTVAYYFKQPGNEQFMNMQFEMPSDHGGRLEGFEVAFYDYATTGSYGTPDPDLYVWLSDGTFPLDNNPPFQAIAEFHKDFTEIVWYPGLTEFDAHSYNLIFDAGELFHIGGGHAHEAGDTLAWLGDAAVAGRASSWDGSAWGDFGAYEFVIHAIICPIAPENPTFSMRCTPSVGPATPGDPPVNVYTVEVGSIIGYAENVTLTLLSVDPPENITATFSPNGIPPDFVSDVAITVGGGVPYGDYILTFQGTGDDAQTKTCDVTLRVQPPYDECLVEFFHGSQRVSNFGAIGNADQSENFVWYGANYLYDGTIISAIPVEPYSEHMALDVYNCEHMGFIPTQHAIVYYDPDYNANIFYGNFYTEEDVISCEWDSLFVIGIMDSCVDFSIMIKIYYNPIGTPIPELYAGIFEDWDVGDAGSNWGDMDTLHNLMWQYDVADPSIVFGIMKAPFYDEFAHNMTFVHNPTEVYPDGDSSFDCGSEPGPEYLSRLMRTQQYRYPDYWTPDPDDFSTLIVGPPFALPVGYKHIDIWINFGRNLNDGMTWKQWRRRVLRYTGFYRGEVNASDTFEFGPDVGDVVYLINYLYRGGPAPIPFPDQGDVNADRIVNIGDLVYMVSFLFKGGPAPIDYVRFIPAMWSRPSLFSNPNW